MRKQIIACGCKSHTAIARAGKPGPSLAGVAVARGLKCRQKPCGVRNGLEKTDAVNCFALQWLSPSRHKGCQKSTWMGYPRLAATPEFSQFLRLWRALFGVDVTVLKEGVT
jgi:hypothetical protein